MRAIFKTKNMTALDRDGICQAQQAAGAGDLTINGALASGGSFTSAVGQRIVGIYSGGNLSALTFTVYGTDDHGRSISENVTGPNNATVSTVLNYNTVTRVAVDGAVGSDVEIGTTGVGCTPPIPLDQYLTPFNAALLCRVTGTINYTVQYTGDDVFTEANHTSTTGLDWTDHSVLASLAADADSDVLTPVGAIRLKINSVTGSASVQLAVRQAGLGGA